MTPIKALIIVNSQFLYQTDKEQFKFFDVWKIMKSNPMIGDCEDYALTVLWLIADRSYTRMAWWIFTRKAKLHFYTSKTLGTKHVGLEYAGAFVDNITARWNDGSALPNWGYRRRFRFPTFLIALKFLVSAPFLMFGKSK